jgi:tetratricopeptide (TPR) repeat protein
VRARAIVSLAWLLSSTAVLAAPREDGVVARVKFRACSAARREKALELCRAALAMQLSPRRGAVANLVLARNLAVLERWDEALAAYREALRLAPEDADAAFRVGTTLLYGLNRAAEAEAYLRQAIAGRQDAPQFHLELGVALNALGRHDEAKAEFAAALHFAPAAFDQRPAATATRESSQRSLPWP